MSNKRPRYRILVGSGHTSPVKVETLYYFEDTDPPHKTGKQDGKDYGMTCLYDGGKRDFVSMRDAHDAIVFCNELNAKDQAEAKTEPQNHILPLRTGGSGGFLFGLFR